MVIDLSLMKGIRANPVDRTVRAQAGLLLGELEHETQAFGLVVPAGFISRTGLAGLTLGGGIGFTMRKFGLTIDFLMDEGQERVRQAYGPARYERLQALKRKYDPDNFFRLNQNIPPG